MNRAKNLEVNYKAYTLRLIKDKLPYVILGAVCVLIVAGIVISRIIISAKTPIKKVTRKTAVALKKYTVQEGEDLWQIAEKEYGSGFNAYDIAKANSLQDPYVLQAGQVLVIPDVRKRFPTHGQLTPEASSTTQVTITGTSYTVKEGDYLFAIAEKAYGDGNLMWKIIQANNIPDPYNIETGQVLQIPR